MLPDYSSGQPVANLLPMVICCQSVVAHTCTEVSSLTCSASVSTFFLLMLLLSFHHVLVVATHLGIDRQMQPHYKSSPSYMPTYLPGG